MVQVGASQGRYVSNFSFESRHFLDQHRQKVFQYVTEQRNIVSQYKRGQETIEKITQAVLKRFPELQGSSHDLLRKNIVGNVYRYVPKS